MDLTDLKTFEAVARHGSMNKAAAELNTVQSNVTARIRALEDALGLALFERHARGVIATPAGKRMLPFVGRIARLMDDARNAARDDGTPGGTLALGALETITALRLSPLLTEFASTYADVRLVVSSGNTPRLMQDVVDGRLDGAFVAGPVAHPDLRQSVVFTEELVLATSPAIRTPADLSKVADLKTIVFQLGCSYRQRLEAWLAGRGIVTATPLEFGSLDAILSCVAAGVGVTLLPAGSVAPAAAAGKIALHRMPADVARVKTLFVRRHDGYASSALTAFLALTHAFAERDAASSSPSSRRTGRRQPQKASPESKLTSAAGVR